MNIKEFTESAIAAYLKSGGKVNPDVTLHLFQFIESDEKLLHEYNALKSHYKEVNPMMGANHPGIFRPSQRKGNICW